jgi:hypothetical protein
MLVVLTLCWEKGTDGADGIRPLFQEVALPYVPRLGESVELWPGFWRKAEAVRVHRQDGTVHPEVGFGEVSAFANPEDAQAALAAARADGWSESWPQDVPPTVYLSFS